MKAEFFCWFLILLIFAFGLQEWQFRKDIQTIQADTERRVLAEVTDNAEIRCRTNNAWLGFSKEDTERVNRIARDFHISPQFLGTFWGDENGRIQHETGMYKVPASIRIRFHDPRDWALAATADMITKIGMRHLMDVGEINWFIKEIAQVYNPANSEAWERDFSERMYVYFGYDKLPITRARTPKHRRKAR